MHMHATPCDGTIQKVLIRKSAFVVQCSGGAGLIDDSPWHDRLLVLLCVFMDLSV